MAVETMQMPRQTPRLPGPEDRVAQRITVLRRDRGWSNAELARRVTEAGCPINQSAIQKIEHGNPRRTISLDEALAFAEVFGMSLEELTARPFTGILDELARIADLARKWKLDGRQLLERLGHILTAAEQVKDGLAIEPIVIGDGLYPPAESASRIIDQFREVKQMLTEAEADIIQVFDDPPGQEATRPANGGDT